MTNRFTENARRVLADAARTAGELGHAHIGSEHILLAITLDGESTAMRVLRGEGITSDGVRRRLIALLADQEMALSNKLLLTGLVCLLPTALNAVNILMAGSATQLMSYGGELLYLLPVLY